MRVCVTGGAGFIGSHVTARLLEDGHEVLVLDDLSTGRVEHVPGAAQLVEADIRSEVAAVELLAFAPEVLCHHAAQIDVRRSMKDPVRDTDINVVGLVNVLDAARRGAKLAHVLFASTGGAIYGDGAKIPVTEEATCAPGSVYGFNKWLGEQALQFYAREGGFTVTRLRYANVYGPRQRPDTEAGVVAIFSQRLRDGVPLVIYGDGEQTRDFVYVGDVAEANALALEHQLDGAFNVGTGVETNINTLARTLINKSGQTVPLVHEGARRGEQRRSAIHPGRLQAATGWAPRVALDEGLAMTLDWMKHHPG